MRALSLQNSGIREQPGGGGRLGLERVPRQGGPHVAWPAPSPYHPFDAFREEEAVVQSAHGVVRKDLTLLLEQKVPSVQTVICPEDGKPPFLVSMDEGPGEHKHESLSPGGRTRGKGKLGAAPVAPGHPQQPPSCPTPERTDTCSGETWKEKVFTDTNHMLGVVVKPYMPGVTQYPNRCHRHYMPLLQIRKLRPREGRDVTRGQGA